MLEAATVTHKVSIRALPSSMVLCPATRNHQSSVNSPTPESICTLNTEALQLHLDRHNLVTTGKHQELVERLLRWPLTRTHHAQHSPSSSDSLLDNPSSSLLSDSSDTHSDTSSTTATGPSTIVTAGGTPIGIDTHLRTAGWPMR